MRRIRSSLLANFHSHSRRSCDFGNLIALSNGRTTLPLTSTVSSSKRLSNYRGGTSITSQILPPQPHKPREASRGQSDRSLEPMVRGQRENVIGPGIGNETDYSVLQERIASAVTTEELLDVVEGFNPRTVDERVLMTIIHTLFSHIKSEKSDSVKKDVLNSVGMQKVCKILRQHCRWMTPNDILTASKVLIFLNASSTHSTLGTLLHLLSKHANSLNLREIIYFQFLLSRTPESPITNALQVALPIVFESQLQLQLDIADLALLTDSFQYAIKSSLSDKSVQYICDGLIKSKELLNAKQAVSILWSLTDLKRQLPYHDVLLASVFKTICSEMDQIRIEDLITTASKISKKFGKNTTGFYNEDFLNGVCSRILNEEVRPVQAIYLLKPISHLRHVNIDLLEKMSDITLSNPSTVLNSDFFFMSLIRSFSGANYKPDKWASLAPIFLEHPAMTKDLGHQEISIAVDFITIDVLPSKLIAKIFSEDYIPRLEEFVEKFSPHLLLLVYNAVKLLYAEEYQGPLPPKSMVEKWKTQLLKIPKVYPLKGALQAGFGGENYLITGLFHEGFHLDHGVIMRKGGYPISIQTSEPETLTRLQEHIPPESIIVMVKAFLAESYANNTNRLRGVNALELKLLEKLGHPVVAIDVQRWKELQDYEKIPYLMHRVREKCEKFYQSDQDNIKPY